MSQPAAAHPTRSLYYTGTSSIDQTVSGQGDLATVILTLETSSETVKLDADDDADPFYLKVTARVTNSAKPASPITIATGTGKKRETPLSRSSNLARESSVAIDWGVLGEMVECTKPEKRILAPRWRVCGSWSAGGDLRAARHWDFVTLPSETSGDVFQIKHKYPMKRLRENGALPGETYSIGFGYWGQNTGYFCWHKWGSLDQFEGRKFQYVGEQEELSKPGEAHNQSPFVDEAHGWCLCDREDTKHGVQWVAVNACEVRIV